MKKSLIFSLVGVVAVIVIVWVVFGGSKIVPSVFAEDQSINNDQVTVSSVTSPEPGWLVIQTETNSIPGPVIGYVKINKGETKNVSIKIDRSKITPRLFAMIHVDDGQKDKLDFPGNDMPLMYNGDMVSKLFSVN